MYSHTVMMYCHKVFRMGLYHLINVALKYKDISSIAPYIAHYHCNVNKDFHGRFIYKIPSELEIKNLKKMSCMNESMTYP